MRADVELWQLLLYGAFCLAGGVFVGWLVWKAPDRRRCGAAVFGPGVRMAPKYHCARQFQHRGPHRPSRFGR